MSVVTSLRSAQGDIRRAAQFYEGEASGLGGEFFTEIERALERLREHPEVGAPARYGARKLLVRRFPYVIVYRVVAKGVLVLAVGHQRRHPDFWLNGK